jgi:multidrug efflux pump subunit AcrB
VWTSIGIRKDDKMELIGMIALMCLIITTSLMIVEMVESAIKLFNERSEEE